MSVTKRSTVNMDTDFIFFNDSIHAGCCYAQKNSKEAFV